MKKQTKWIPKESKQLGDYLRRNIGLRKKKKRPLKQKELKRHELYKKMPQCEYISWKQLKVMLWQDCNRTEVGHGRIYA